MKGNVKRLTEALLDDDPTIRREAARALGELAPESAVAVTQLTEALRDYNPEVRAAAASALGRMGPGARRAIPALARARDDRWNEERNSMRQIGFFRVPSRPCTPGTAGLILEGFNPDARAAAAAAIARIESRAKSLDSGRD